MPCVLYIAIQPHGTNAPKPTEKHNVFLLIGKLSSPNGDFFLSLGKILPLPFRCHNFGRGSRFPNISFNSFHPTPTHCPIFSSKRTMPPTSSFSLSWQNSYWTGRYWNLSLVSQIWIISTLMLTFCRGILLCTLEKSGTSKDVLQHVKIWNVRKRAELWIAAYPSKSKGMVICTDIFVSVQLSVSC